MVSPMARPTPRQRILMGFASPRRNRLLNALFIWFMYYLVIYNLQFTIYDLRFGSLNIRILPHCLVGAYRIRPKHIHVDKLAHSGVCDTPLQEVFADIQLFFFVPYRSFAPKTRIFFVPYRCIASKTCIFFVPYRCIAPKMRIFLVPYRCIAPKTCIFLVPYRCIASKTRIFFVPYRCIDASLNR